MFAVLCLRLWRVAAFCAYVHCFVGLTCFEFCPETFEALTSRVNSLSVALRAGYLSVRTTEGVSEKQSSLKARLRNGLTYLLVSCHCPAV